MGNNQRAVSVIIPTHNRADLLVKSVESVLRQTFRDFECIIVDDASCDATQEEAKKLLRKDKRIVYHRHEINKHAAGARNTGIGLAAGDFIAFLDDDDEWLPSKLERQTSLFERLSQEYGCVYCWADYVDDNGLVIRRHRPSIKGDAYKQNLVRNAIGCTPSLLIRRDVVKKTGSWNESLRTMEDDEYILRLCKVCKVDYVPEVLVKVNTKHGGSQVSMPVGVNALKHSLDSVTARYALFHEERFQYPRQAAELEALIGNFHGRMGNKRECMLHFFQAIRLDPLGWEPYHMLLSLAKWKVSHA